MDAEYIQQLDRTLPYEVILNLYFGQYKSTEALVKSFKEINFEQNQRYPQIDVIDVFTDTTKKRHAANFTPHTCKRTPVLTVRPTITK